MEFSYLLKLFFRKQNFPQVTLLERLRLSKGIQPIEWDRKGDRNCYSWLVANAIYARETQAIISDNDAGDRQ